MASVLTAEQFKANVDGLSASFDAAGMLVNDGADEANMEVLVLIPDVNVSLLIGKSGANINALKEVTGVSVSFTKQEESVRGMRKCFVAGTQKSVFKAIYLMASLIGETQTGGKSFSLVVGHKAAGAVIGKGGENLKNLRAQTGCHTSMEKQMEAVPSFAGRTLTLKHDESAHSVAHAVYLTMRIEGFASVNQKDVREAASSLGGYGPAANARSPKQRFNPYGGGSNDMCTTHGKKRGKQNLQPSQTMPGHYQCFDHDQCKGAAIVAPVSTGGYNMYDPSGMMGGAGMMGMGAEQYMGMAGMGQMMGGMGQMGGMAADGGDPSTFCALHNKRRGAQNLQPHPSNPQVYTCMETDPCKGAGGSQPDSANICATHGKRRGAQNMMPHPTATGMFVCQEHDQCK